MRTHRAPLGFRAAALVCASAALASSACHPVRKRGAAKVTLAVLPAESDRFPRAARAVTDSLTQAELTGIDEKQVSKVSLEVVQLSIECVEHSVTCYAKVGTSLAADRLLFAEIDPADKKRVKVRVKVTLFDVDSRTPRTAQRVFANEREAAAKIGELVSEATR